MTKKEFEFGALEELPEFWEWMPLEKLITDPKKDIVDGPFGSDLKASEYKDKGVPIARLQNIDRNRFIYKNIRFISHEKAQELGRHNFRAGDILITKLGYPLGKACIVPQSIKQGIIVADLVRVRLASGQINQNYLVYAINSPPLIRQFEKHTKGTTRPRVNLGMIRKLPIPVAPPTDQKLIVAEIEKEFSRLDEAVAALKRIQANLKRYKASVLKAAVEGKLTEQWRKEHPDVEPASKLLKRILVERRKNWEEDYIKQYVAAHGHAPKDDSWKKKYKEPAAPDTSNLPQLPNGWVWATLPQLGELNRGKSKHRPRNAPHLYGGPYPFVQTGDIKSATGVIRKYKQTYSEEGLKQSRLWPKGTLCITIAANIADTAILGFDACFPDSIVGYIAESENVDIRFVEYFFRTAKENIERFAPATAQKNINLEILNDLAISLPPVREQQAIINEIDQRLSVTEEIDIALDINLKRSERLRHSILKKAFSGGLGSNGNVLSHSEFECGGGST